MCKRASNILKSLDRKHARRELDKALVLAKDGRIDEAAELLVRWQGYDDGQKGWEAVYRIACRAVDATTPRYVSGDFLDLKRFPMSSSGFRSPGWTADGSCLPLYDHPKGLWRKIPHARRRDRFGRSSAWGPAEHDRGLPKGAADISGNGGVRRRRLRRTCSGE